MSDIEQLEKVLSQSFHKHGDAPITLGHMLNIVRVARIRQQADVEAGDQLFDEIAKDINPLCQEF